MRSAGLDLTFFAYHSLDVFAFLLSVIYVVWRLVKWFWIEIFSRRIRVKIERQDDDVKKNR